MAYLYTAKNMSDMYITLASEVMFGKTVGNTKERNNVVFEIEDPTDCIALPRGMSYSYMLGELVWYLCARNDVDFIKTFGPYWEKISDDGVTSNSAYGYIVFKKHGFDQYRQVVDQLRKDPNSRRAKINISVPNANSIDTKDEPCTIALDFMIRDGRLHCTAVMRSSDIWLGIPYDVVFFTTLQRMIADELGIAVGTYTHFSASLHAYEKDFPKILAMLKEYGGLPTNTMVAPRLSVYWLNHYLKPLESMIIKHRNKPGFKKAFVKEAYRLKIIQKGEEQDEDLDNSLWTATSSEKSSL